jgi:putative addiction module component (TIGR02574 family)
MRRELLSELKELTPAERIEVVEFLWDSLELERIAPITPEELDEIERELAEHRADPRDGLAWDEVKAWLWSRRK